jgi:uncharacterized protein involved in exopolysaccharide biosynthesis
MFRRYGWIFAVMALIGPIIGFVTSAVVTYVMPKMYESEAIIEVRPSPSPIPGGQKTNPQFFATEFNKITSRNSLIQVIDALQLTERWNVDKETAVQILKGIVHTENIRGTDLISIRVRHTDKVAARDIANEVAQAYKDYRNKLEMQDAESWIKEIKKAIREKEDKVEEHRKILTTIIRVKGKGIIIPEGESPGDVKELQPENPPPNTGKPSPAESEHDAAIRRALDTQDYIDSKRDLETEQQLHEHLRLKLISAEITSKIPNESVEIHDEPTISNAPVSPNVTLNLLIGTIGGFLLSPLMSLLVIGVMKLFTKPTTAQ